MWYDYTFSQKNKATKRALGLKVGSERGGMVGPNLKNKIGNIAIWYMV